VLDAKHFGTPQRRRRVYIVGSLGNLRSREVLFDAPADQLLAASGKNSEEALPGQPTKSPRVANFFAIQHASIGRKPEAGPQAKGYRNDGETYTLDSRGSADAVCSTATGFRVRKAAGISKGLDSNRLRAIGNAVCVPIIEWIGGRIAALD
jgi:DNA (cytosine-5)-methyltransferase 1